MLKNKKHTLNFGLIGCPVSHSFSPAMHAAAYQALQLNASYELFEVTVENLEPWLQDLSKSGLSGINVTVPHKVGVYQFIEKHGRLTDEARLFEAVNTVTISDGVIYGANTDGIGFLRSLKEDLAFDPKDKTIFIIGAGGSARAVTLALGDLPKKIIINARSQKSVDSLILLYKKKFSADKIEGYAGTDIHSRDARASEADLIINATNVGMQEEDGLLLSEEAIRKAKAIYDCIYNPPSTPLLSQAKKRGVRVSNGLGMLLYQGAESFKIWLNQEAPIDVMRQALLDKVNLSTRSK